MPGSRRTEKSAGEATKIYQIDSVKLAVAAVNKVKITAEGKTRTGGWTEQKLVERAGDKKSEDASGVITVNYDFVAKKPAKPSTDQLTTITVTADVMAPPAGKTLKVVVRSETNEKDDSIKSTDRHP